MLQHGMLPLRVAEKGASAARPVFSLFEFARVFGFVADRLGVDNNEFLFGLFLSTRGKRGTDTNQGKKLDALGHLVLLSGSKDPTRPDGPACPRFEVVTAWVQSRRRYRETGAKRYPQAERRAVCGAKDSTQGLSKRPAATCCRAIRKTPKCRPRLRRDRLRKTE